MFCVYHREDPTKDSDTLQTRLCGRRTAGIGSGHDLVFL